MSASLKVSTTALNYPSLKWIPIDRVDTHSLIYGGSNALLLAGYSNIYIQKWVDEEGGGFQEYIREELHCFVEVM